MVLIAILLLSTNLLSAVEVTIGAGDQQALIPVNMYYRNSLFETIYLANEMNIVGLITGVRFYSNFFDNLPNLPTNIWLGETTLSNLSGGWIPSTDLTPVFAGNVNYPSGINNIDISFTTPFTYGGGNLVMLVQRPWEADYYMPMDYFYAQTVGTNRSLCTYNSNVTIDPAFPPVTGVTGQFPKTTFFVTVQGMGAVSGVVTSAGSPVLGATVSILNTALSTVTGADGSYSFPYVSIGAHSIRAAKVGYNDVTQTVVILENQQASLDFVLTSLPLIILDGRVVGSDEPNTGIAGANITLDGYAPFSAITDASGNFSIAGVFANQTYSYTISAGGYQNTSGSWTVGNTIYHAGNVVINEIAYPPLNVMAEQDTVLHQVNISWDAPATAEEGWLHYDNGTNFNSFGTAGSASFDVAIRYPASALVDYAGGSLQAMRIWPSTGGNFSLRVWTGGNASQPGIMVVDQPIIPVLNSWNLVMLDTPVPITGTEELWFGFLCDVTGMNPAYAGMDAGPAVNGFSNMIFWQGNWTTLLAVNSFCDFNWNIQGYAGLNPPPGAPQVHQFRQKFPLQEITFDQADSENSRALTGYRVWRLLQGQEQNPAVWTPLTTNPITMTMLIDSAWDDLPAGTYLWAVQAVYTAGVLSNIVFTNTIEHITANGTITGFARNIYQQPIAGATIIIGNQTATTGANGGYLITVPAGIYSVTCVATGYHDVVQNNVVVIAGQSTPLSFTLIEVANADEHTVQSTVLKGNFPNPFSSQTTLSYEIKAPAPVILDIYNIKGQHVRTLVDETKATGSFSAVWDGTDEKGKAVSNGIYTYRLRAGNYLATRRMMLIQ